MLNPSDVLRVQMDLAAHLADENDPSAASLDGLASSQGYQTDKAHIASAFAANHVRTARAYHVTADMGSLVQSRFESLHHLPPTTHCPTDIAPPRVCGFVVMEEPIAYLDIRESVNLAHVLTWGPATGEHRRGDHHHVQGWSMTMWNDIRRRRDDVSVQLMREYPALDRLINMRWWPCTTLFLAQDQRIGMPYWPTDDSDRRAADARYERDRAEAAGGRTVPIPPAGPAIAERTSNLFRYFVALWQLFGEERGPAITEHTHPQRSALRLARRTLQTSDITVITLRKRPGAHTGTGTPLDHQLPVAQHYRSYWCTGRACRCPERIDERHLEKRLIAEHLRGPHGTRLIVRKKMERLSR
jgi:hypothetical protein